ncbi:hypothetical protein GCM10010994_43160 [Chelatococcus reniformis]|uniref:Uncharacterized protein n=1 Tax=Chelatococcus reniformis TaxID=1494448 RepID=A0A916XLL1_9HYPH|nr:hypothetical protein GCM10010994_43160 [Chelatococcus reniformis]
MDHPIQWHNAFTSRAVSAPRTDPAVAADAADDSVVFLVSSRLLRADRVADLTAAGQEIRLPRLAMADRRLGDIAWPGWDLGGERRGRCR